MDAKRLKMLLGTLLVALSVVLSGCAGGVSEEQKKEGKEEAEKKEGEDKEKKEEK